MQDWLLSFIAAAALVSGVILLVRVALFVLR
jgi:hypothetical protein